MKNKRVYPVILTPADNIILVEVPDMEILTEGKDYQDAIEMARDAIGLKGITLEDAGKTIPDASDISVINPEKGTFAEDGKGYVILVDVDFLDISTARGQQSCPEKCDTSQLVES